MKYIMLLLLWTGAAFCSAESLQIEYGECTFTLPSGFIKSEKEEYFTSLSSDFIFKSVAVSYSENPMIFVERTGSVEYLKIYKASNFYVFSYGAQVNPEENTNVKMDFVIFWRQDKSITFAGLDIDSVKLMMSNCPSDWYPMSKDEFSSAILNNR